MWTNEQVTDVIAKCLYGFIGVLVLSIIILIFVAISSKYMFARFNISDKAEAACVIIRNDTSSRKVD